MADDTAARGADAGSSRPRWMTSTRSMRVAGDGPSRETANAASPVLETPVETVGGVLAVAVVRASPESEPAPKASQECVRPMCLCRAGAPDCYKSLRRRTLCSRGLRSARDLWCRVGPLARFMEDASTPYPIGDRPHEVQAERQADGYARVSAAALLGIIPGTRPGSIPAFLKTFPLYPRGTHGVRRGRR